MLTFNHAGSFSALDMRMVAANQAWVLLEIVFIRMILPLIHGQTGMLAHAQRSCRCYPYCTKGPTSLLVFFNPYGHGGMCLYFSGEKHVQVVWTEHLIVRTNRTEMEKGRLRR